VTIRRSADGRRGDGRLVDGGAVESSSPIPLYYQIANVLQARIYSGASPPGSLLGTEKELAETFGVSRITIQKALQALHQEGLIDRQRARGTFVAPSIKQRVPIALHGYLEDILLLGETGKTLEVERDEVPASDEVAERLGIPAGSTVVRVRRLRTQIEDIPFTWVTNYLPMDIARLVDLDELRTRSVTDLLDRTPGLRLTQGHETISAEAADEELAARLRVPVGTPLLLVERELQTEAGRTVDLGYFYSRNKRYTVRLSRLTR
jgi:DNA-binding GntR family transcriptional regulator